MDFSFEELIEDEMVPATSRPKPRKRKIEYEKLMTLKTQLVACIKDDMAHGRDIDAIIPQQCFVYGVVTSVQENSNTTSTYVVRIKDETMSDVRVRIVNDRRSEAGPLMHKNHIIRIHRLTVQVEFDEVTQTKQMTLSTCPHHNYTLFKVSAGGSILSKTSAKKPSWNLIDQRRVFQLSRWIKKCDSREAKARQRSKRLPLPLSLMESPRVDENRIFQAADGGNESENIQNPPDEIQNIQNPPEEIPNIQNPPDEIQNIQNPPEEIPNIQNPPDEIQNIQNPPEEIQNIQNPPDEIQNIQNPPDGIKTIPNEPEGIAEGQREEIEQQIEDVYREMFRDLICKIVDVRTNIDYSGERPEHEVSLRVKPLTMLDISTRRLFFCDIEDEPSTVDIKVQESQNFIDRNLFHAAHEFCRRQTQVVIAGIDIGESVPVPLITIDGSSVDITEMMEEVGGVGEGVWKSVPRTSTSQPGKRDVLDNAELPQMSIGGKRHNERLEESFDSFHTALSNSPQHTGPSPLNDLECIGEEDDDDDERDAVEPMEMDQPQSVHKLPETRSDPDGDEDLPIHPKGRKRRKLSSSSDSDSKHNYHLPEPPKAKRLNFSK